MLLESYKMIKLFYVNLIFYSANSFDLKVRMNESSVIKIQRNSLPTPIMPPILVSRVRVPVMINIISDYQ